MEPDRPTGDQLLAKLDAEVLVVNPYANTAGVLTFDRAASAARVSELVRASGAHLGAETGELPGDGLAVRGLGLGEEGGAVTGPLRLDQGAVVRAPGQLEGGGVEGEAGSGIGRQRIAGRNPGHHSTLNSQKMTLTNVPDLRDEVLATHSPSADG